MRARAFAAAWTVFTVLAAPALLLAQETPPAPEPVAPVVEPAPEPAPVNAEVQPDPAPAPAQQAQPAPAPEPAEPVAQVEAPEEPEAEEPAKKTRKPKAHAAASASVTIKDFEFGPASVTVNVGDTVTWVNQGPTVHTATASDGSFDTGNLQKGASGSATFSSAGTFSYICTPHPFMKGTVTVADTGGGSSAGGTAGSTGSGSGTGGTTATDTGPSLPNSGADAWALALLGTGLLSLGFAVRRRAPQA